MNHFFIFGAQYLVALVVIGAVAVLLVSPREQRTLTAKRAAITGVLAVVLTKLAGALYFDPRPFTHGVTALISHAPDNGFPSDHTVVGFVAALLAFTLSNRAGAALLLLSVIVAWCRVKAGVHNPVDVIAGAAIGAVSVVLSLRLAAPPRAQKPAEPTTGGAA